MKTLKFIFILFFTISQNSYSQEEKVVKLHQLSGLVVSTNNLAVPFANIWVKNYNRGTNCNFEGFFSLVVKPFDTLVISSIGFKKQIFVVPDTIKTQDFFIEINLKTDNILLSEILIFPWKTYDQFKNAVVKSSVPTDDMMRANSNLKLMEYQMLNNEIDVKPGLSYKYLLQQSYNKLYYAGQLPPNNLLNPIAWGKFFESLKNGDLKIEK